MRLIKRAAVAAVCVFLFAGPENPLAKNKDHQILPSPENNRYFSLDDYLKDFLHENLPLEKYTSSVRWDAWERDCMRYPQGKPDLRGEKLFRNLEILDDPSSLDIFFIGLLHIPLFYKGLKEKGFKPYITCWHFQEKMNDWDPFQILRYLRRDPIAPTPEGEPCMIIGDRHGKNYTIPFPNPVELRKRNINKVHFHIELLKKGLEPEEQLEDLKKAVFGGEIFWGQRKIHDYIQTLKRYGIEVQIDGIEPPSKWETQQ